MMASFSEGLLLSEKVGLDPGVLVEVQLKPCHILLNYSLYVIFN
jgi:3-hydroxyisobutyrate dehydrogenase-like beta-hydroxyacid dehydrogenase